MFEYTNAFLSPFSWAKSSYQHLLGDTSLNSSISLSDLTNAVAPSISTAEIIMGANADVDWNNAVNMQVSDLGAIYQSIDQAEAYINTLYSLIDSRLTESENRIHEQERSLNVLLSSSNYTATTSVNIEGGDLSSVDLDPKWYTVYPPVDANPEESSFKLKSTGFFSSLRSQGGFAGKAVIEYSLGEVVTNGKLAYITDGSRNTFWTGTYYAPAPVKADQNDIPWLPDEYKHGFAIYLTYYMDRPTSVSEIFIDPVISESMDLVSVSWSPMNMPNTIINSSFESASGWVYSGNASRSASGFGVLDSGCLITRSSSGWASQTFSLSGTQLASGIDAVTPGNRLFGTYSMKGIGDLYAGARIVWLDASGSVISYKLKEDYPTGFFSGYKFYDIIPTNAASGRLELGIFNSTTSASALFDNVFLFLGEKEFKCNELIDRPKTINLPEIALSDRYSFVLVQRNPRRELSTKEASQKKISIRTIADLDSTLQKAIQNINDNLSSQGPGTSRFTYRIGLKELDLRYREHIPRGSLVSLPLKANREIREIWVNADMGQFYNDAAKFNIYPFENVLDQKVTITPFVMGNVLSETSTTVSPGEILRIYTTEEVASGWANDADKKYVTNPVRRTDTFEGTTRDSKVKLKYAPHIRRPLVRTIQEWVDKYSVWPTIIDPNLETIWGLDITSLEQKNAIRSGTNTSIDFDALISRPGYIPISVTVKTDSWVAYPDTMGRPDNSRVRSILKEILTETTATQSTTESTDSTISYNQWMTSTRLSQLIELNNNSSTAGWANGFVQPAQQVSQGQDLSLREILDKLNPQNVINTSYEQALRVVYNRLKFSNKLTNVSSTTTTSIWSSSIGGTYKTKYSPILTGPRGTFITLYWFDPVLNNYLVIPANKYKVQNSSLGHIKISANAPSSGYTQVLADYKYLSNKETEDHFSILANSISLNTSSSGFDSDLNTQSRYFPVTRNMTDYITGRTPNLKEPNFDTLDENYHPVIEYYVNTEGELIFSREFFKYGDVPAQISVEYDTLAIRPRVSVEIARTGYPSISPTINGISLRVREGSPIPTREST